MNRKMVIATIFKDSRPKYISLLERKVFKKIYYLIHWFRVSCIYTALGIKVIGQNKNEFFFSQKSIDEISVWIEASKDH